MRDPDRTIEKLLAGLRDAEPPSGMHHRILDAMVARPATVYGSRRLLHSAIAMSLACGLAIAIWVQHPRHLPASRTNYTTHVEAPRTKPPQTVADRTPRRTTSRSLLKPTKASEVSYAKESPGFPAPPLPLTEQEKQLLRFVHRNDARDMTLLNRDVQAQQSAKATQQFQKFFGMDSNEMRSESE
jgi:hypothetical protein